jgi:copper transport protein
MAWLMTASPALAHANLVRSDPPANSAQKTAPTVVRLWFSETVEASFSSVEVLDKAGMQVDTGDSHRMADDPKGLQVSLNLLPEGLCTVVWRATSAVDGHVTAGSFVFTVGDVPVAESSPREIMSLVDSALAADAPPPLYEIAVRWLNLLLLTLLVGALMFPLVILFPAVRALASRQPLLTVYRGYLRGDKVDTRISLEQGRTRWLTCIRIAFLLFVVMTFVTLVAQAFTVGTGVESIVRVLTATRFGIIWLFRTALLVALGFILWRAPADWNDAHPSQTLLAAAAIGLLLLVAQSLNSHDAAVDAPPVLPFLTDWVHLLGVAVWVGGLVQLLVVAPVLIARQPRLLATLVSTFSLIAFGTVGAVIISGLYSAYLLVGSLDAFFATLYGTALFVKLVLILPLLSLGALNLIVTRPFAAQVIDTRVAALARRFDVAVALEVILAAAVLLAVGAMTSLEPAKSAYNPSPALIVETHRAGDLYVTLGIAPGLVGTNDFDIKVRDLNGQPVTNALVVRLLATMRDMEMGTQEIAATNQGNGHYTFHGDTLSMVGNWDMGVLVRRAGVDDVRTSYSVLALGQRVPPTSVDATILQNTPALQGLGLTLLAFAIGTASVLFVKKRSARRVALGGAMAVALIGAYAVFQSAPANTATAYVAPAVPPTARLVRSPIAPVPAQIAAGQQIYQQNCAVCHGTSGKGDGPQAASLTPRPADLTVHVLQHAEGELYWWITYGIPTTAMPAWQDSLTDTQRWQVVAYIRTLGKP